MVVDPADESPDDESDVDALRQALQVERARRQALERTALTVRERYHFLARSLPHIMWSALPNGWPDYYNQRWWDYTGLEPGQVPDDEWAWPYVLHPDDIGWSRQIWSAAVESRQTFQFECRLRRASDGEYRWHRVVGVPMYDEHGQIEIWAGTATDIDDYRRAAERLRAAHDALEQRVEARTTELLLANVTLEREIEERRRVEGALRESQELFQSAFEHASTGVALSDLSGRWQRVNRAFCQMLHYEEKDLLQLSERDVTHPDDRVLGLDELTQVLAGTLDSFRTEKRYLDSRGHVIWVLVSTSAVRDQAGTVRYLVVQIQDMTDRKRSEEALASLLAERSATLEVAEHRALHDVLTDLPNRALLRDRGEQGIRTAHQHQVALALLLLDLDGFKRVNDTYGHYVGDLLLREVAARLRSTMREVDTVARVGGDEFAMLLPDTDARGIQKATERILTAFSAPFIVDGQSLTVGTSVGAALYPTHGERFDLLMQRADVAMYRAKRARSGGQVYQEEHDDTRG